jgi:hypothetical protein
MLGVHALLELRQFCFALFPTAGFELFLLLADASTLSPDLDRALSSSRELFEAARREERRSGCTTGGVTFGPGGLPLRNSVRAITLDTGGAS